MNNLKLCGGKLEIDPVAVFLIALITAIDKTNTAPFFLLSAFLHEMGHIISILLLKSRITKIILEPFSLTLERPVTATDIKRDIIISISGVLSNFLLFCLSFFVFKLTKNDLFLNFCMTNALIGIYNLLPLKFLDGGEIINQAEKMILGERARGVLPMVFHILTVLAGIIAAGILLIKQMYFAALMCLYPVMLTPVNKLRTVKRRGDRS